MRSSVFGNANPSNLSGTLLEGNKDHLLSQARSDQAEKRTSWSSMEDPVVPLERNLYGHPLAGLLWERQFEKVLLEHGSAKV